MTLGPDDLPDPFGEGGMSQLICACTSETFHFVFTDKTVRAICSACKAPGGEWLKEQPLAHEHFSQYQFVAAEPGTYLIDLNDGKILSFHPAPGRGPQPWQGAAQHTWTPGCDGNHPPGPCPVPAQVVHPGTSGQADPPLPPPGMMGQLPGPVPGAGGLSPGPVRPAAGAAWGEGPPPERGPLTDEARKGILPPPPLPAFSAGMCNVYLEGGPYDGQITWLMAGDASQDFHIAGWATYKATSKTRDGRVIYQFKE
jgi:hypothetical protein